MKKIFGTLCAFTVLVLALRVLGLETFCLAGIAQAQDTSQSAVTRRLGAIKTIAGNVITLAPDSGADITVNVLPNARILRISPGAKDLKDASPIQLQDLKAGDRVRVRGQASSDGSIGALEIIAMARTDIEARHQQEQQDWQKRGLGGLVSSVDPSSGTVTISVTGLGGKKEIAIHTAANTMIRRYAPDSVKFDDAKPSSLTDIHPGDQLRARGDRSPDGSSMQAEEVVTGSFRNIAGTVNSVDATAGTVNVQDLLSKKTVVVKITTESQLHKLPPEFAQRIAARLKGSLPPGTPGANGGPENKAIGTQADAPSSRPQANSSGAGGAGMSGSGMNAGGMGGSRAGSADFQQILAHMPGVTLADLHKGDAVVVVATEGTGANSTAITLLSGVEPILQAAPNGSQAMMLTPWSLGGSPGGEALQ